MIFDRAQAVEQYGDDPEFMAEIVGIFTEEMATLTADGDAALNAGNLDVLAKVAHRMKGALGQMMAEDGRQAALAVEVAAKADESAGIDNLWQSLLDSLDRLRPELAPFA